jgi:hypothetical protein
MAFVGLLTGTALLLLGRKLYWLFVGGIGLVFGIFISGIFFPDQGFSSIIIALLFAIIGVILAFSIQKFSLFIAGFIAGGYLFSNLLSLYFTQNQIILLTVFIIGGIIGAGMVAAMFDWALILLSSLVGSFLVSQSLPLNSIFTPVIFFILVIIGIIIQSKSKNR